jgi:hypothetical protein
MQKLPASLDEPAALDLYPPPLDILICGKLDRAVGHTDERQQRAAIQAPEALGLVDAIERAWMLASVRCTVGGDGKGGEGGRWFFAVG